MPSHCPTSEETPTMMSKIKNGDSKEMFYKLINKMSKTMSKFILKNHIRNDFTIILKILKICEFFLHI